MIEQPKEPLPDDDDGDDRLPGELEDVEATTDVPDDEVDERDPNLPDDAP